MNIFKFFKNNKGYKDLKIANTVLKSTKICTFNEFFEAIGADKEIKEMKKLEKVDTYHIDNIRFNESTSKKIDSLLLTNLLSKKNKYAKHYKEHYLRTQHSFDSLIFSPKIDKAVPDNVVRIITSANPEYKTVKGA